VGPFVLVKGVGGGGSPISLIGHRVEANLSRMRYTEFQLQEKHERKGEGGGLLVLLPMPILYIISTIKLEREFHISL